MIDYKEIFEAWKISLNPTQQEEELGQKRLNVCLGCEYRKELLKGLKWTAYCNDCGCPLNKKVFSKTFNPCTQKKWKDVDSNYMEPILDKTKQTII
jgi:hypothetical protein